MKTFLFSVDLEEFYPAKRGRSFRHTPLPELAETYLAFLRRHDARATFFVVGDTAAKFPEVIRTIADEGHELGCHTHTHRPLNEHTRASLDDDLRRNLDAIREAVATPVRGFRAPILSLTERTRWAYEVLASHGFEYSSSVLPAGNPLHGWPGFGDAPRTIDGVLELPLTVARVGPIQVPIAGGTYFRCLSAATVQQRFRELAASDRAILGYFHPYDIDTGQALVMHSGVRGNPLLNLLLFVNRGRTIKRLDSIMADGFRIITYAEHIAALRARPAETRSHG